MKKIMFNDRYGLTRAVLDGQKTQTRRMIPKGFFREQWYIDNDTLGFEDADGNFVDVKKSTYNRYQVGENVAVAQSYYDIANELRDLNSDSHYNFRSLLGQAGLLSIYESPALNHPGGHNKLFVRADLMIHQIRITNVRVERLRDISDDDCVKEGILKGKCGSEDTHFMDAFYIPNHIQPYTIPREAYAELIDRISGKGTWGSNPYVFVYDFELII